MAFDGDSVLLLGYRSSSPKPNGRRRKNKHSTSADDNEAGEGFRMHMSDSELGAQRKEIEMERSTVFSDDSLPSVRAHLAASQMQTRSLKRDETESSFNERRPLLTSNRQIADAGDRLQAPNGMIDIDTKTPEIHQIEQTEPSNLKYSTISTRLVMKRRNKKAQLLRWFNRGKVALLTFVIVASVVSVITDSSRRNGV